MAKATTTSPAKRFTVSYTIRDGENDYEQHFVAWFAKQPTERQVVAALVERLRLEPGDIARQQRAAWKQYQAAGCLEIPGDYRIVSKITWEPSSSEERLVTYRVPFRESSWGTVTVRAFMNCSDEKFQDLAEAAWLSGQVTYLDHEHEIDLDNKAPCE